MVMDEQQSQKMITWLDDERRKDKVLIAQLEQNIIGQHALVEDLVRRIQSLESESAVLRSQAVNEADIALSLDGLRAEMRATLEHEQERREKVEREAKKIRDIDREGMERAVADIRNELLARFERDLAPRMSAEEHLTVLAAEIEESAKILRGRSEEGNLTMEFLEEQRRIDSKRVTDLSNESVEVRKRFDNITGKMELLEALARRNERMATGIDELKQHQQDWAEDQDLAGQRREKLLTDMQARLDGFQKQMEGHAQKVEEWGKTHVGMKKYVDSADKIAERIDMRLNEVAELVRISSDRLRQEWEAYTAEESKRWKDFTLMGSESWRENERKTAQYTKRIDEISDMVEHHEATLEQMIALEKKRANVMGDYFQGMVDELGNNKK